MTPAARWQAAIDLLRQIAGDPRPADAILNEWARGHRFAGSKDRAAISDRVFAILRRRGELAFTAQSEEPRALVLASARLLDGDSPERIEAVLAAGGQYAAAPLTAAERDMLADLPSRQREAPAQAQCNVPGWLMPEFETTFGADAQREAATLAERAPMDLRVNTLKMTRADARARLAAEGIESVECQLSPVGLRVHGRGSVTATSAYRDGLVEVQDEGSQIAALLADARPGHIVVDLCAGAGGKSLALAATMQNTGRLVAVDSDRRRLARLGPRAERAGASLIEAQGIDPLTDTTGALAPFVGAADRVLVDAPCSGSGAWRRRPEEKWRLTPERLADLNAVQARLLAAAAGLVRPGGRLVYVTCSILPGENSVIVAGFLDGNPDFRTVSVRTLWSSLLGTEPPALAFDDLLLSPVRTGTDGFYVAVLERTA